MQKILICMPTYHSPKKWLERAITSISNQTYTNFECWIVKDGCMEACNFSATYSANTCLECENCKQTIEFCQNITDSRFKFYSMPINFGAAGWGPRNFAIMNTTHQYIAYLDDDNWYEPDHIESLYNCIQENNCEMAYTGTRLYNTDNQVIRERLHPYEPKSGQIDTSEIMHDRKLIYKYGGWRCVSKCNDWDLIKRWMPHVSWGHTNKITLNFFLRKNCGIHRL